MPLFFFISGFVFSYKGYNFITFFKRKIKSIIIPYITLGVPVIIFTFLTGRITLNRLLNIIIKFVIQKRYFTLWFIACLFCLNIIFYVIVKLSRDNLIKIGLISVSLTIVGLIYYKLGGKALPWNLDVCFTAITFFYVGYLLKIKRISLIYF